MSLRLKRHGGTLVGATLAMMSAAVMLGLFPAVAEAQTEGTKTSTIVARPGGSLWSMSEERLGPDATPQRIVNEVEKLYALNRERLGADPDLVFVGQELSVPPGMSSERLIGATTAAHMNTEAAEVGPRDRAAKSTRGRAPRTASEGADAEGVEAPETVVEREAKNVNLPDEAAPPVPAARTVASNDARSWSSVASFLRTMRTGLASAASALTEPFFEGSADARVEGRLLGLGVLVITLVTASLVAWKLSMRRTTRRGDAERWGASSWHYGYYDQTPAAYSITPTAYPPGPLGGSLGGSLEDPDQHDAHREAQVALGWGGRRAPKASAKAGATLRNGPAFGVHDPKVRRISLRTRAPLGARKPRYKRRASFVSGARS